MDFKRTLNLSHLKTSAFLFGPRMTGKTTLIRNIPKIIIIDLLDPIRELDFRHNPRLFWEEINALPKKSVIAVDEVQRIPVLLDYVQKGIEEKNHLFILSGSSARKLKRGGANLLGGRAIDRHLHPLTHEEIGEQFNLTQSLSFGTLPRIIQLIFEKEFSQAQLSLRSYYTTYIKEEIQAEAITRNVGAFQRFLNVAVQGNAQVIEFANISRECAVPMSSVKEYYSILEDTLLGAFLWPWDRSERKKARPKFYFFDCGVIRAISNRLNDPPTPHEIGFLFETWFIRELIRIHDYLDTGIEFSFWREGLHEIDLLLMKAGKPILAIECKSGQGILSEGAINLFHKRFPKTHLIIASLLDHHPRKLTSGVEILPWKDAIKRATQI